LKQFYNQSLKYGFNIEIVPDTSYVINDKLISLTQEDYNSLGQKLAKFDSKHDKELIYQINEFMKNNL